MENCIFCQIAQKKLQAQIRYEDQQVIAFDDVNPKMPVHILVIPKKHIESVNKIAEEDTKVVGQLILAAAKLAKQLKLNFFETSAVKNINIREAVIDLVKQVLDVKIEIEEAIKLKHQHDEENDNKKTGGCGC